MSSSATSTATPAKVSRLSLESILTNYRGVFCLLFLLPLSFLFDLYMAVCSSYQFFWRKRAPEKHRHRVAEVQKQVLDWGANKEGDKQHMCSARPGWQAMSLRSGRYKRTNTLIKLDLFDILEVNTRDRWVRVEPMVSMGQLSAALNGLGWTLPVLPELDDLTVGGLIAGVGVETSSHLYGLFQHTCLRLELVMADGSVVECSEDENPALFSNVPWSHGTLGFVVSAWIRIVPCKPFVRLRYIPCQSRQEACALFDKESRRSREDGVSDFVEAIAFGPSAFVVMLGTMVHTSEVDTSKINRIGRYFKPWFFKHVEGVSAKGAEQTEYIPLRQYYHRHTRSLFWEIRDIMPFSNMPLFRYSLGWMMPPKPSLLKLTQTEALRQLYEKHHVVQDMIVPLKDLEEALQVFDSEFFIFPLWLCPLRIPASTVAGLVGPLTDGEDMYVDIGAYGNPQPSKGAFNARQSCRAVEAFVRAKKGYQMLYADSYMSKAEFRGMFDHTQYDALRKRLPRATEAFPEVYEKVCKKNRF